MLMSALFVWTWVASAADPSLQTAGRAPVQPNATPRVVEAPGSPWQVTVERVTQAVVSIKVTGTRDFDTEDARVGQGTGFVVDAERGLVLTNRHMVHAGPVRAEAIFLDNEEVELIPIYRDPVHDFGFYRFDPRDVRHMEVAELPLAPHAAGVGTEIRVIGNDAGEKLSILDSTLARLDRNAPRYGSNSFNDFNTFYIQAASNTSGGSSGSPVVDIWGQVVALNAGGATQAASSFYLPLQRVVRALEHIQQGTPIPRGTLQTVLRHQPFDELARLGLPDDTEADVRQALGPSALGMLVVDQVVPEGPADEQLKPGDILLRADGELVGDFVTIESLLDDHVGDTVSLEVQRGSKVLSFAPLVGDLHAITPDDFLEVGRGVVHDLSYHQARNHQLPVRGVYVAVNGYMWATANVPEHAVITHIDGIEVPDLDAMQAELEQKADGQRLRVRFHMVSDERQAYERVAVMDRRWYAMARCTRNDTTGLWPCVPSPAPPELVPPPPAERLPLQGDDRASRALAASMVLVEFDIPHPTAGVKDLNFVGVGTVIDAERGLVLVDRDTVPVALGDMQITFAGSVRLPGRIVFLHPTHNAAIIKYEPALLGDLPVRAAELRPTPFEEGDRVWQVGLDGDHGLVTQKTRIDDIDHLHMRASTTPRFRDANMTGIWTEEAVDSYGGVLADRQGRVGALWASFLDQASGERGFYGMPIEYVRASVDAVRAGKMPTVRTLGVEFMPLALAQARDRGLSDARVRQLLVHDPDGRAVLEVLRVHGTAPAQGKVRDTDLLLEVNGALVTEVRTIEALLDRDTLTLTLLRDAKEISVEVDTLPVDGTGVSRVVSWAGLIAHEPHVEVEAQKGIEAKGVYVAWLWYGSPGSAYAIRPTRRIIQVDDTPTPDLDAFLDAVADMADRQAVRLTLEKLDGSQIVDTLKLDLNYWPTQVFELEESGWVRRGPATTAGEAHAPEQDPSGG